jgi:hypothetical protein
MALSQPPVAESLPINRRPLTMLYAAHQHDGFTAPHAHLMAQSLWPNTFRSTTISANGDPFSHHTATDTLAASLHILFQPLSLSHTAIISPSHGNNLTAHQLRLRPGPRSKRIAVSTNLTQRQTYCCQHPSWPPHGNEVDLLPPRQRRIFRHN